MDIRDTRRARLRMWLEGRTAPTKEKSYFSQLINGTSAFGEKAARRLEREYGMGENYLDQPIRESEDSAIGESTTKDEHRKVSAEAYNLPTEGDNFEAGPDLKSRPYPEISWVQAGMWTEIGENFEPGPDQLWHYATVDLGPHGFVLRVKGSSMTAPAGVAQSFPHGSLIFVNPDLEALPGKFVIVRRNGNEATFKKLITIEGEMFLEALNPDWQDRFMRLHKDDRICGVVREARIVL